MKARSIGLALLLCLHVASAAAGETRGTLSNPTGMTAKWCL